MPTKTSKRKVAKKVSKKTVARKVPVKKVNKCIAKKTTKGSLKKPTCKSRCHPSEAFWINHGPVVHTMQGLLGALKNMTDEQFAYHTKREGNDFACWIKECIKDNTCATSLKKARSRTGAMKVLSKKCTCK